MMGWLSQGFSGSAQGTVLLPVGMDRGATWDLEGWGLGSPSAARAVMAQGLRAWRQYQRPTTRRNTASTVATNSPS